MKIAMYMTRGHLPGGIASYLRRVGAALVEAGHEVLPLDLESERLGSAADGVTYVADEADVPAAAHRAGADVLHLHTLLRFAAPPPLPVVRTVHNHEPYCPSGGRFLGTKGLPCNRNYSLLGCLWGHVVNHCGSVRPGGMMDEFRRTRHEMAHTAALPSLTVSEFLRSQMLRAGYDPAKVQTLALPAPAALPFVPPPTQGVPRFVFLGRFTPEKGVDWLLRAVSVVKREIAVDIAGAGHPAREAEYRDLAESLKVSHRVTFHPWLEVDGVNALLREARALVFPSLWHEPAGLVALEAMAAGRAVIASRVGGVPEFVAEGSTGLLVEPGDSGHLAAAMERLVDHYDLAERLGREGCRVAAESFSVEAHVAGLTEAYQRAVAVFASADAATALTPGLT